MKRSRQVLVISSIVFAIFLLIVASLAYTPGQREITKTPAETVVKTETQLTTPTKMTTEELKTVTSYSTEYTPTTISETYIETTTTVESAKELTTISKTETKTTTESTKELTTEPKTEVKTTTVAETTKEITTELSEPWKSAALAVFVVHPREVKEPAYVQHIIELRPPKVIATSGFPSYADYTDEYGNNFTVIYWDKEPKDKVVISFEAVVLKEENPYLISEAAPHPYPIPESLLPDEVKQYLKPMPSELEPFCYNPDIIALAKQLAQGCSDEAAVVNATLDWIGKTIEYDQNEEIRKQHPGPWTPVETLKYQAGTEDAMTDLAVVLLWTQRIPARRVLGHLYCWVQVYYPKIRSWVNYDPVAWKGTHQDIRKYLLLLQLHTELCLVSERAIATGSALQTIELEDKWELEGIFEVRIRRFITIVPKP